MKSRRTTSACSSSTRSSSRDGMDEVDGTRSSDDSDDSEDEERRPKNDLPVTFEYVNGAASSAFHYKLPKQTEPAHGANGPTMTVTTTQMSGGASRKGAKSSVKASSQLVASKKNHHQLQQTPETVVDSSSDECATSDEVVNQSLFLKLLNTIREFFYNRKNWSVTEESIIIWFGFMFFAVVVGCILHFLMA